MNNSDQRTIVIRKNKPESQNNLKKVQPEEELAPAVSREIGKGIVKYRTQKEMNQKDLATKANIPVKILADWENGKGIYNQTIADKLQKVLGVDLKSFEKPKNVVKKK